jgi:hypothetical protein
MHLLLVIAMLVITQFSQKVESCGKEVYSQHGNTSSNFEDVTFPERRQNVKYCKCSPDLMPPEGNLINVQPKTGYTPTSQIQN